MTGLRILHVALIIVICPFESETALTVFVCESIHFSEQGFWDQVTTFP